MKVNRNGQSETVEITADGEGLCSHAGALLLSNLADRLGLTADLSEALGPLRKRRGRHDPGQLVRDLAITLAQGGEHLSDLAALRNQPDLFGNVSSDSTAFRLVDAIGPGELEAIRAARAKARERAFALGARPKELIIDIDATLVNSHSDKEGATGTWKKGYGFHPFLSCLEGSDGALAGILREGRAGSNTAADQIAIVEAALEQLPAECMKKEILVRADGAGSVHELLDFCREGGLRFSVGFDLTAEAQAAIDRRPESAWVQAVTQAGEPGSRPRTTTDAEGNKSIKLTESSVCELTGEHDLSGWPEGSRLICRRERTRAGEQLDLLSGGEWRYALLLTDVGAPGDDDLPERDRCHREHAHVEQRICDFKALGGAKLPFREFAMNEVWLELVLIAQDLLGFAKALCLEGGLARARPKALRYRLLHQGGRVSRSGRRTRIRLSRTWPWSEALAAACRRLDALPIPAG